MNFKYLIEILKDKNYIEIKKNTVQNITISISIKTKYESVKNKIINELPKSCKFTTDRDEIIMMSLVNIEEWVEKVLNNKTRKNIELRKYLTRDEYILFKSLITKSKKYKYHISTFSLTDMGILIDIQKELEEQRKKEQEIKEVDDFIASLP